MSKIYITKQTLTKWKQKLEYLLKESLKVTKEKAEAWHRDGDGPHDNPMYHKFKDELTEINGRIQELKNLILHAHVIKIDKINMNEVSIGSIVEFKRTMKRYSEIKKF